MNNVAMLSTVMTTVAVASVIHLIELGEVKCQCLQGSRKRPFFYALEADIVFPDTPLVVWGGPPWGHNQTIANNPPIRVILNF